MVKQFLFLAIILGIASGFSLPKRLRPDYRIVGGVPVNISSFGWQVSVQRLVFNNLYQHFCGGSILNQDWILTAAHCIKEIQKPEEKLLIRVGSSKWNQGGVEYKAKEVIVHPKYNPWTFDYDVGLIRVAKPIALVGRTIRRTTLIEVNKPLLANTILIVTGWGDLQEGGPMSVDLQGVSVPVVDNETCDKNYNSNGKITKRMICAGYVTGGKDSCQGDSGGPIVDIYQTQVGIVSWGDGCARPVKPGVYTKIAHEEIRDFISKHTGI